MKRDSNITSQKAGRRHLRKGIRVAGTSCGLMEITYRSTGGSEKDAESLLWYSCKKKKKMPNLPEPHHEDTSDEPKLGVILQSNWPASTNVKVMKVKRWLKNVHAEGAQDSKLSALLDSPETIGEARRVSGYTSVNFLILRVCCNNAEECHCF